MPTIALAVSARSSARSGALYCLIRGLRELSYDASRVVLRPGREIGPEELPRLLVQEPIDERRQLRVRGFVFTPVPGGNHAELPNRFGKCLGDRSDIDPGLGGRDQEFERPDLVEVVPAFSACGEVLVDLRDPGGVQFTGRIFGQQFVTWMSDQRSSPRSSRDTPSGRARGNS